MAAVASSGTPSIASVTNQVNSLSGLLAGEAISAGMPCYIKASDGKVYKSNGTSANEAAAVHGWAAQAASAGEAITLVWDVRIRYGSGLTPGTKLFVATTAGTLVDAATTGGSASVGFVVDATRIHVWQSRY